MHAGHRSKEFLRFLKKIDKLVARHLNVHVVCDKLPDPQDQGAGELAETPQRFKLHFTPTSSSWLNLVERLFAVDAFQRQLIAPLGGTPADFRRTIAEETARWTAVVAATGLKRP